MSHKKFGPDRFSRFDVYWIQTDKQTDKQTSQIYIQITRILIWLGRIKTRTNILVHSSSFDVSFVAGDNMNFTDCSPSFPAPEKKT